ncbi:hypothetical protein Csa_008975 [Cucumis sativus]|nr:hypothetical protein Csa_008975 [Cucumis sativus]
MAPLTFLILFFTVPPYFFADSKFLYNGFHEGKGLNLDGAAIVKPSGALCLTSNSQNVVGHAFYPDPVMLFDPRSPSNTSSFSTTFVFAIDPSIPGHGGHGLAFTLAPSTRFDEAESGHYLGLFNPLNDGNPSNHIFAVEFDTVKGHGGVTNSRGNHIGININGISSVKSQLAASSYYVDDTVWKEIQIDSGDPIVAWIDYDGRSKNLSVTIGLLELKPEKPLILCHIDLTSVMKNQMFVGFAASTGIETSAHYILGWSFAVDATARQLKYSQLPNRPNEQNISSSSNNNSQLKSVLAVSSIIVLMAIVILTFLFIRMKKAESLEDWEKDCPHRFNFKDIYTATNGFNDSAQIGIGGFGSVYKGKLSSTGAEIAVKRVKRDSSQGMKEFAAEIESLGRLRHKNLVNLQGWCKKQNDLLIVYDYIPNGSYIPPELFRTGKASKSADVFAYGVLLLEVACGRKPLGSNQFILMDWVMEWYETGDILHVADPKLDSIYKVEEMEMVLQLGLLCTHWKQEARPSMRQVMRFLNREDPLPASDAWTNSQSIFESSSRLTMTDRSSSMSVGPISSASINEGR